MGMKILAIDLPSGFPQDLDEKCGGQVQDEASPCGQFHVQLSDSRLAQPGLMRPPPPQEQPPPQEVSPSASTIASITDLETEGRLPPQMVLAPPLPCHFQPPLGITRWRPPPPEGPPPYQDLAAPGRSTRGWNGGWETAAPPAPNGEWGQTPKSLPEMLLERALTSAFVFQNPCAFAPPQEQPRPLPTPARERVPEVEEAEDTPEERLNKLQQKAFRFLAHESSQNFADLVAWSTTADYEAEPGMAEVGFSELDGEVGLLEEAGPDIEVRGPTLGARRSAAAAAGLEKKEKTPPRAMASIFADRALNRLQAGALVELGALGLARVLAPPRRGRCLVELRSSGGGGSATRNVRTGEISRVVDAKRSPRVCATHPNPQRLEGEQGATQCVACLMPMTSVYDACLAPLCALCSDTLGRCSICGITVS
mmetsp:Transcript_81939/g.265476  ORF Transcript_81939/g.265476 Transcript_81939/m.265476 type:complete len:424 (+) Transcript_81939:53-1324(+)